ncbi:MAG: hypothetical protein WCG15_01185, partial [Actinomycetes bacterium]
MMARYNDAFDSYTTPTSFLPEDSAVKNAAKVAASNANATAQAGEDNYYTKVVSGGKTQAQLDALANARTTATTIRDTSTTMTSQVNPVTGKVITTPKGTVLTGSKSTIGSGVDTSQADAIRYAADKAAATEAAKAAADAKALEEAKLQDRQSAYDLLFNEFSKYGLGSLVQGIKGLIQSNVSPSQFAIELQNTKEYQQRFSANQDRIKAGLKALSPAEYIGLEDQYQNIMRNYGLPASYYAKDSIGTQAGFNKLLGADVSATELEDRIATAQQRVLNSNPEVLRALKQFYPDINNADILAYTL